MSKKTNLVRRGLETMKYSGVCLLGEILMRPGTFHGTKLEEMG